MPVPTVQLVHGAVMPRLGLGTWPMTDDEAEKTIPLAVELGYRLLDTAYAYGNEHGVGRGVHASGIAREEVFVTTKLNGEWHGYREAQEAFAASVERLGLDYVDLYLIHWPLPRRDRYVEAWRGLAKLLEDGRARAIGVSNFKPAHIDRLLAETGVVPDVNQIELDPSIAREATRAYNAAQGIVTESWSPLGHGSGLLSEPIVTRIAARRGRTPAQIVLRWHIELGLVTIPKSTNPGRLRENIDIFDFAFTPEEAAELSSLDRGEEAAYDSDLGGH